PYRLVQRTRWMPRRLAVASAIAASRCCSLALQRAHRPLPLAKLVGPPLERGLMWSLCRLCALQYGPAQVTERPRLSFASPAGKARERCSVATRSPLVGFV